MTATVPNHAGVALRAYYIWEDEGRPHGHHEHHWFAAEAAEVRATIVAQAMVMDAVAAPAPVAKAAPAKRAAPVKKAATENPAAVKKSAPAKAATPKAPAETVMAAAALAAPRAAKSAAKGARRTH